MLKHILCLVALATPLYGAVQRQSLNGDWTVIDNANKGIEIPAKVPGGIFSDLMDSGKIGDVFYDRGDTENAWVGTTEWNYTTSFTVDETLLAYDKISIVFEGVDTFANISINDVAVGYTENMYVRYVFNVKEQLKAGTNTILVGFKSAVNISEALNNDPNNPYDVPPHCPPVEYHGICYANRIRKMPSSFAWDWGPAFASVGIWKDVYLQAYNEATIDYIVVTPEANEDFSLWNLTVKTYFDTGDETATPGGVVRVVFYYNPSRTISKWTNIEPKSRKTSDTPVTTILQIKGDDIKLWWPNGYGAQPLYEIVVEYHVEEVHQDRKNVKFGFRTLQLVQEQMDKGLSFYIKVNNQPIFAKGSNEIPINILPEKGQDKATIKRLLQSARDVNMNMLRVWGGGVYESDYFYELADEYGIMIWQDFMFACALYPTDESFISNVVAEFRHQIRRLGSHPSITVWSGNNENEVALSTNWYGTADNFTLYKADYIKLYVEVLQPELFKIMDSSSTIYITASPTNGLESIQEEYLAKDPNDYYYGDIHFYNYDDDSWELKTFPVPRFSSEYGYQSLPSVEAWLTATDTIDNANPNSDFLTYRQHHPWGNPQNLALINYQMQLPDENSEHYVQAYIYFTQIVQAQSIKIETENYRSFKGRLNEDGHGNTWGALYWQLNDVWVAPSWAGIDYTGRWKILHYQAKDFLSTIQVTGRFENDLLGVYAIIDALEVPEVDVRAVVSVYQWSSLEPALSVDFPVNLSTSAAVEVTKIDVKASLTLANCGTDYDEAKKNCFFHLSLVERNNVLAPTNYNFLEKLKNSNLADAKVKVESVTASSDEPGFLVQVSTDAPALFVWLDTHDLRGTFSENGFLQVDAKKIVHFSPDDPNTTVDDILQSITVTHLRDAIYL